MIDFEKYFPCPVGIIKKNTLLRTVLAKLIFFLVLFMLFTIVSISFLSVISTSAGKSISFLLPAISIKVGILFSIFIFSIFCDQLLTSS